MTEYQLQSFPKRHDSAMAVDLHHVFSCIGRWTLHEYTKYLVYDFAGIGVYDVTIRHPPVLRRALSCRNKDFAHDSAGVFAAYSDHSYTALAKGSCNRCNCCFHNAPLLKKPAKCGPLLVI